MNKLAREDLYSLEEYAQQRADFRKKVMAHKKQRQVKIGQYACLYFEDRLTMLYQIQEMLRIERIFEPEAIAEELDTYNPLIPNGMNLKATFMLEYGDPEQRRTALAKMIGIEDRVWVAAEGSEKVFAIANEDLERSNAEKTSAVHFLRFELPLPQIRAITHGANLLMGIDHDNYQEEVMVEKNIREALAADFEV